MKDARLRGDTRTKAEQPVADKSELTPLYSAAVDELAAAELGLAEAQRRHNEAQARVRLLEELLALADRVGEATIGRAHSADLLDNVVRILKSHGSPMTVSEIQQELLVRGIPLPGKGDTANLIARFQRSSGRIVRVGRGLYDLPWSEGVPLLEFDDGRQVRLGSTTRIGKGEECEIVLSDSTIDAVQALLTSDNGAAVVSPLGKSGKVLVNGQAVEHATRLVDGDRLSIGETALGFRLLRNP